MKKFSEFLSKKLHLSGSQMIAGLAAILLGLILMIAPGIASAFVFYGIGAICIVIGLFNVIRYFTLENNAAIASNALAMGLIWSIAGTALILLRTMFIAILPIFFGFIILIGGIAKLQGALTLKRMNARRWYFELAFAIISILFGAIILLNPFSTALLLMRVIGIALFIEGLSDMVSLSTLTKKKREYFIEVEMKDAE